MDRRADARRLSRRNSHCKLGSDTGAEVEIVHAAPAGMTAPSGAGTQLQEIVDALHRSTHSRCSSGPQPSISRWTIRIPRFVCGISRCRDEPT